MGPLVGYLGVGVEVPRGRRRVARRVDARSVRPARVERVDHDLLRSLDLGPAKRTALTLRVLRTSRLVNCHQRTTLGAHTLFPRKGDVLFLIGNGDYHLPSCETGRAEQVPARFDPHVLVVFRAYLAQLEGAAHLAVELVLLGRDLDVLFGRGLDGPRKVGVDVTPIGVQVAARKFICLFFYITTCNFLYLAQGHSSCINILENLSLKLG